MPKAWPEVRFPKASLANYGYKFCHYQYPVFLETIIPKKNIANSFANLCGLN